MTKKYNQEYVFDDDYVPLKLRAEDEEDLQVISALLQDGLVPSKSLKHNPEEKTFTFLVNRFRWEETAKDDQLEQNERVFAFVLIKNVDHVHKTGFPEAPGETHHDLLCLRLEEGALEIDFAGGEQLLFNVSELKVRLRDISDPWPTEVCPIHKDVD